MTNPVTPRPHHEWCEEDGNVLWWLWPIEQPPYVGTPLDLGYTVEGDIDLASSCGSTGEAKVRINVGGWPFARGDDEDDDLSHRLYWTPLPDIEAIDVAIRDDIRGGPVQ